MPNILALSTVLRFFSKTLHYLKKSQGDSANLADLKRLWAEETLKNFKIETSVLGTPMQCGPVIFVGNHMSYLDIPLLMFACPEVSFLAKREITKWPIIGAGAARIGTIFVNRGNTKSRGEARYEVIRGLSDGKKIAVFPSGTTCLTESKEWRRGIFEIAYNQGIPVQPFRLKYSPARAAAFVDRDIFPYHLFHLARQSLIKAQIEFHTPIKILDPLESCSYWRKWSRQQLLQTDLNNLTI